MILSGDISLHSQARKLLFEWLFVEGLEKYSTDAVGGICFIRYVEQPADLPSLRAAGM